MIKKEDWLLGIIIALFGILFTTRFFILFLNSLNPFLSFLIYYLLIFTIIYIMSKIISLFKTFSPIQIFGILLIWFSFMIIINFTSSFIQYITTGSFLISNILINSEDGIVWYLFFDVLKIRIVWITRILTYAVTPFILATFGRILIGHKET